MQSWISAVTQGLAVGRGRIVKVSVDSVKQISFKKISIAVGSAKRLASACCRPPEASARQLCDTCLLFFVVSHLTYLVTTRPPMAQRHSQKAGYRSRTSLYDAVAGRVTSHGLLQTISTESTQHDLSVVPPEEALYRRDGAPIRYEEDDEYFQNRHLTADQRLPDSDLLKIIHTYAADFYAATSEAGGKLDERSLNETALLALGILLEESVEKLLGKTGHLALVEDNT